MERKTSLKIWKVTCMDSSLDTRVNSLIYKDFILEIENEITSLNPLPELSIRLQLDNARPHLKHPRQHLLSEDSIFLPIYQPASSPDLQPAELIWDQLKKKVYSQPFSNLRELTNLGKRAWEEVS